MNLSEFYQDQNRTSGFMDPDYGGPHWGQDFNSRSRLPEGTSIPALSSGTVVRNGYQSGHGYYLSHTAAEPGWYWTYSHRTGPDGPGVGQPIGKNQSVGRLGNTGLSTSPHLHVQYTQNPDPWKNSTGVAVDPWPKIVASLASWAGGGTEITFPDEESDEMHVIQINDGRNALGGGRQFYMVGPRVFVRLGDDNSANAWAELVQKNGTAPNVTYSELYEWARNSKTLTPAEIEPYRKAAGR